MKLTSRGLGLRAEGFQRMVSNSRPHPATQNGKLHAAARLSLGLRRRMHAGARLYVHGCFSACVGACAQACIYICTLFSLPAWAHACRHAFIYARLSLCLRRRMRASMNLYMHARLSCMPAWIYLCMVVSDSACVGACAQAWTLNVYSIMGDVFARARARACVLCSLLRRGMDIGSSHPLERIVCL